MPFKLTLEDAHAILDPCDKGDWEPFGAAMDPEVRWWITDDTEDPSTKAGVYNWASWKEKVNKPLLDKIQEDKLRMRVDSVNVVGNTIIAEASGFGTQKNGKPYRNRFAWFIVFSEESGKVIEIREYMNSALVKEVHDNN